MNHIYRIIFNRASGVFQVVSELVKGKVKSAKTSAKLTALCMALVSSVALAGESSSTPAPTADNTQNELTDLKAKYEAQQTKIEEQEKKLSVLEKYVGTMPYEKVKDKKGAEIKNPEDVAIGVEAKVDSSGGVAIGYKTYATRNAVAIGNSASTYLVAGYSVAIGYGSVVEKTGGIALGGYETKAKAANSISIGISSMTGERAVQAVSIGESTNALGVYSTALGTHAGAIGDVTMALGYNARAIGDRTIALGTYAKSYNYAGISIGDFALSRGEDTISIGRNSEIEDASDYSIAMGNAAYVGKKRSPASGSILYVDHHTLVANGGTGETGSNRTAGDDYIVTHPEPEKRQKGSIAIGLGAKGYGFQTIAIGGTAEASGSNSLAIGIGTESRGLYSLAVGDQVVAYKDYSSAFGHFSSARAEKSLALGANTEINEGVNGGVALGSDSFNNRDLATIGYDISEQATKLEINGNKKQMTLLGEAGKKYQELQAEIDPLKKAYEKELQNYADLAELRNTLYDLPKKEVEVKGLETRIKQLKDENQPQAQIDKATKSYETAKNELEKMQEELTALKTKTGIQATSYDEAAKVEIQTKLDETKTKADKAKLDLNKKEQEQNKLVSTWKGTAGSVSVGNEITGITRQITGVAAGTEDTDAVNVAQLKSLAVAGIQFSANDYDEGDSSDEMKAKIIKKHIGGILPIQGKSGTVYGSSNAPAANYSSDNLITFNDNGTLRIGMLKAPTFSSINLGDTTPKALTVDNGGKLNFDGNEVVTKNNFGTIFNELYEFKNGLKTSKEGDKTVVSLDKDSLKNDPSFKGDKGDTGLSAKAQWLADNPGKTETDYAAAIKGEKGDKGEAGKSAKDQWLADNPGKTETDYAAAIKGEKGDKGEAGKSAKDQWLADNPGKTETDYAAAIKGEKGDKGDVGKSAYEIWRDNGNTGKTEQQFVGSLNANTKLKERVDTIENTVHNHSREIQQNRNAIAQVNRDMQKMNKELRAGIAGAIAIGSLYQNTIPGKETISAGVGSFKGQNAVAVGYSRLSDNGRVGVKANLSINSSGDAGAGASIGYTW